MISSHLDNSIILESIQKMSGTELIFLKLVQLNRFGLLLFETKH